MSAETADFVRQYDTVRELDIGDCSLILVGEHHSSSASQRLVEHVLHMTTPGLVAIESCPSRQSLFDDTATTISKGTDAVINYARNERCRVGLIDKSQDDLLTDFSAAPPEPVPFDAPEPDSSGDISAHAVHDHRSRVAEECPRRYDIIIQQREEYMAGYLATFCQITSGNLVAIVGAGHLHAVADKLGSDSVTPLDIPDDRIQTLD